MKNIYKVVLTAILIILGTAKSFADVAPIAQVVWTKGAISAVRPNNATRNLARRAPIYIRDTIVTGANSEGQIVFTDQSILALRPNSAIKIAEYQAPGANIKPSDEKYVLELVKGGMRTVSGIIGKDNPDGYAVNTPVATIGIRGTEYAVVCSSAIKDAGCATVVYRGAINIRNSAGSTTLAANTATRFSMIKSLFTAPKAQTSPPPLLQSGKDPALTPADFQSGATPAPSSTTKATSAVCVSR